jgi:ribonuclease HI
MVHLDFKETNNMAEYEALIFGLSTALALGVQQLLVKGDSQLIVKQVNGECCCNDPQLAAYLLHAEKLEKDFEVLDLHHIPCTDNAVADDLSTKALKGGCSDLQPSLLNRAKGAGPAPQSRRS